MVNDPMTFVQRLPWMTTSYQAGAANDTTHPLHHFHLPIPSSALFVPSLAGFPPQVFWTADPVTIAPAAWLDFTWPAVLASL
jgi:hypothetical protein